MKKGLAFQTIIIILVLVIVFVLLIMIFLTPKGLLQKAAERSSVILSYLPGKEDPAPKTEVKVPQEVETMFNSLVNAFRNNKNKTGPCLVRYGSKVNDLNKNVITFSVLEDKTVIRVLNDLKQVVQTETVSDVKPCVVAGVFTPDSLAADLLQQGETVILAQNFYLNYFVGTPGRTYKHDFLKVSRVSLTEDDISWDSQSGDSRDGSFLYVPEKGRICFFPTWDSYSPFDADYSAKGLHNSEIEKLILINRC